MEKLDTLVADHIEHTIGGERSRATLLICH